MNWAWHQAGKPVPKLVLMALADAADDIGICWPSVTTVAANCNVSTRTERRVIRTLAAQGLLVSEQRYRKDVSRSSNRYRLLLSGGDKLPPAPVTTDSPPGHPRPGDPDTRVIPRTTRRTQTESPQPQGSSTEPDVPIAAQWGGGNLSNLEHPKGLVMTEREQGSLSPKPVCKSRKTADSGRMPKRQSAAPRRSVAISWLPIPRLCRVHSQNVWLPLGTALGRAPQTGVDRRNRHTGFKFCTLKI